MNHSTKLPAYILESIKIIDTGCWEWQRNISDLGYARIGIKGKNYLVSRIVAEIVYGKPNGRHCLHSCDNPACINPEHLRWGTPKENMQDKVNRNRCNMPKGEANHKAKLTQEDVRYIRTITISPVNKHKLAKQFDVSPEAIRAIWLNKTWSWLK